MSVYLSILLYLLCAFNFGESLPKKFGEGVPKDIELKLEVSPETPVLGESFYVRVTVTNMGDKEIEMPNCIRPSIFTYYGGDSGHLLELLSPSLAENRVFHTTFSAAFPDAGYVLLPSTYNNPIYTSKTSMLSPGKSRILLLDRIAFVRGQSVSPESWNQLVYEQETNIRFSYFGKDEINTGSIAQPIRILPMRDTTEFTKIADVIADKKVASIKGSGMTETEIKYKVVEANRLYRSPRVCFLLPTDEGMAMSDKYPPGTIRAEMYLGLLANKHLETDDHLDAIIRWFWTLPEIERQIETISILTYPDLNKQYVKLRMNRQFLEVLIKNFPVGYDIEFRGNPILFNGNPINVFLKYANCANMDNDEIESAVESILKSPIPQYAGQGNLQRGFFIAPRKWSFSDEEFQLISYFNTDVTFKDQDGNIKTFPADKLSSEEQKFLRTLSDFPQTGVWPVSSGCPECEK